MGTISADALLAHIQENGGTVTRENLDAKFGAGWTDMMISLIDEQKIVCGTNGTQTYSLATGTVSA
jgi:hypothetical protein